MTQPKPITAAEYADAVRRAHTEYGQEADAATAEYRDAIAPTAERLAKARAAHKAARKRAAAARKARGLAARRARDARLAELRDALDAGEPHRDAARQAGRADRLARAGARP